MGVLAHCWLMIECFVIPHGFIKWFYLSFYIHPFFLPFCQIFLWLRNLVLFLYSPVRMLSFLLLSIFRFIVRRIVALRVEDEEAFFDAPEPKILPEMVFLLSETAFEMAEESIDQESCCTVDSWLNDYLCSERYNNAYMSLYGPETNELISNGFESILPSGDETLMECGGESEYGADRGIAEEGAILQFSDSDVARDDEFSFDSAVLTRNRSCESPRASMELQPMSFVSRAMEHDLSSTPPTRGSMEQPPLSFDSPVKALEPSRSPDYPIRVLVQQYPVSNSDIRALEQCLNEESSAMALESRLVSPNAPKNKDSFHQKLTEGFRFFNLLYQERLHGFRAISIEHNNVPRLSNATTISTDLFMEEIRTARPRILSSLESDFELIYVAQTTIYWESLYHQYQQVKLLTLPDDAQNRMYDHTVSGKFQELQILLERFLENENSQGLTCSSNIPGRLSFHCSIQVPDVTEFTMEEHNSDTAEAIRPSVVLKAIEKCIEAFWSYIDTDKKKSSWKYKSGIRVTHPTVEDPLDLELLYGVMKAQRKKETMMKHLQGKRRCCMRRKVEPLQTEDEKINLMFAMIDMKLVERVLKMSLVSGSQLRWCQDKLSSLDFEQGRVSKSPTGHLFPCS